MKSLVEAGLLLSLVLAPWAFGSAIDEARYALASMLLGCIGFGLLFDPGERPRWEWFLAAPTLGLLQVASGIGADALGALGSILLLVTAGSVLDFWSRRGRDREAALRAALAVLAVCVVQSVFAAWQWQIQPGQIYGTAVIAGSPFGSFVNHNHFAGFIEMGALLAAGMAVGEWGRRGLGPRFVALGGVTLLLLVTLLASRSRGGVVAFAAGACTLGLAVTGFRLRRLIGPALVAAGLLALGVAVLPAATGQRLATLWSGPGDASFRYRLDTAGAAARLALSSPLLGVGLGSFPDEITRFKKGHGDVRVTHAESDALELLAETGLVGGLLVFWLGRELWGRARANLAKPRRSGVALGSAAAVAALLAHSLFDFNLRIPSNALVFATLLGLVAAPRRSGGPGWTSPLVSRALGVAVLFLAFAAAFLAVGAFRLQEARTTEDPRRHLVILDGALEMQPLLDEAYWLRARSYLRLSEAGPEAQRLELADRDLERCLRLRPRWALAWADLGRLRFRQARPREAAAAFERATSLDPTNIEIAGVHAAFLGRVGPIDAALAELRRVEAANPELAAASVEVLARRWRPGSGPSRR